MACCDTMHTRTPGVGVQLNLSLSAIADGMCLCMPSPHASADAPPAWAQFARWSAPAEQPRGQRMPLQERRAWAERLGIIGPLRRKDGESDVAFSLRCGAFERAIGTVDAGRMRTMLGWAQDFVSSDGVCGGAMQGRLFVEPDADWSRTRVLRENADSLDAFGEYMRRAGSKRRGHEGKMLQADGIQAVVAMARQLRELYTRGAVVDEAAAPSLSWKFRAMRREDGVSDTRSTKRAFRATQFRRALDRGWDRASGMGQREWAAALVAHNALLRGGELGHVEGRGFDAGLDMTWRSITWCLPNADSRGRLWLLLWVVPIKYRALRNQVSTPIPIVRRQVGGVTGDDPLCTYDALFAMWVAAMSSPPISAAQDFQGRLAGGRLPADSRWASVPLFLGRDGRPWGTHHTRDMVRRMAAACGEDPDEFGGSSLRSGGATDVREHLGDSSQEIIKQRGRWASDVAKVYQRALLRVQLDASFAMGEASGADMEAVCAGWSQPTGF